MRARIRSKIDGSLDAEVLDIEDGQAVSTAVVRRDGPTSVPRDREFMRSSPRRERGEGLARRHIDERGGRDALVEDDERAGSPVWALSHERRRARSEYRADDQELESHGRVVLSPTSHHQANPPASAS